VIFYVPISIAYARSNEDVECMEIRMAYDDDHVNIASGIQAMISVVYFPTAAITAIVIFTIFCLCCVCN